jgi:hypothetical protein
MLHAIRTRFALSFAVLAIAALSVAPAYAAPAEDQRAPGQRPPQPTAQFKPDLRVTTNGAPYVVGSNLVFPFKVENIGAADSGAIALKGQCEYWAGGAVSSPVVMAKMIGGLKSGHSTTLTVACEQNTSILMDSILTAGTQNDLDTANNSATLSSL